MTEFRVSLITSQDGKLYTDTWIPICEKYIRIHVIDGSIQTSQSEVTMIDDVLSRSVLVFVVKSSTISSKPKHQAELETSIMAFQHKSSPNGLTSSHITPLHVHQIHPRPEADLYS